MSTRRRFSGDLKAKVALEALRGDKTIQEIAVRVKQDPGGMIYCTGIHLISAAYLSYEVGPPQVVVPWGVCLLALFSHGTTPCTSGEYLVDLLIVPSSHSSPVNPGRFTRA